MDYMFKKNHPFKLKNQTTKKSASNKHSNIPKTKNKYTPSVSSIGETAPSHYGSDIKKYKSTNKTISVNSLPKIDSYLVSNTIVPQTSPIKGQLDLFVRNKTSYFKNSDLKEEDELFSEIELLWDELGITDEYQDQFELYLGTIFNSEAKNKFLIIEKNNLNKTKELLIKLLKEKKNRLKNIELLKQLNNTLKLNNINGELRIGKDTIKRVVDCIKAIRLNSVNVINNIIKVRESLSCFSIEDKINFKILNKNFSFDNNYLLKMNSELSFLKYSEINKIFEKNDPDEILDTFVTIYNNVINHNENEKISNLISKEMSNAIDKCRYYIAQDGFLNNIKTRKILKSNTINGRKINGKFKGNQMALSNCFRDNNYNYFDNYLDNYNINCNTNANTNYNSITNFNSNSNFKTNYKDAKLHKLKSELGKDYNNIFMKSKQNSIISTPNNRILKTQSKKGANSNIVIERDPDMLTSITSPYKINTNIDWTSNKRTRQDDNFEYKYDYIQEEKINNILKIEEDNGSKELFKKYNNNIKENDYSEIKSEEKNEKKNGGGYLIEKEEEKGKEKENEIEKEKEKEIEKEKINENNDIKEEEKKEKENKNEDDDDIIDMDYLDEFKE